MGNKYKNDKDKYLSSNLEVKVRYTGDSKEERERDLERALSLFKKIINGSGLMQEIRDRQSFKSPGEKASEKRKKAIFRNKANREKQRARDSGEHNNSDNGSRSKKRGKPNE